MIRVTLTAMLTGTGLLLATAPAVPAQGSTSTSRTETAPLTRLATGSFEVKLAPQPMHTAPGGADLGRMTLDKEFHGDLEAVSNGEMLSAMSPVKGSGVYVAIELVRGTLHGRRGSFVLYHRGTMNRGAQELSVTVAPDSGTDELVGLTGEMKIIIEGGRHSYEFGYALPGT